MWIQCASTVLMLALQTLCICEGVGLYKDKHLLTMNQHLSVN